MLGSDDDCVAVRTNTDSSLIDSQIFGIRGGIEAIKATRLARGHLLRYTIRLMAVCRREFIDENGGGPGVRQRKRHQKKS
jgi:hypothetical protein